LAFLRPAPYLPEIEDPEKVKSSYSYWRLRTLYSMMIGYAFYYFSRKSFIYAMPGLIADLGFTKTELGAFGSVLSITYGISKFGSGILSDRSNARYFMALGLFLTGLANIFFGMTSSFWFLLAFWGLNGWFQGFGWPPCARFLTHWYSQSERGSWWSIWNLSHNIGAFIIPYIVVWSMKLGGIVGVEPWRFGMYIPGVLCILGSFFLVNRLRDTPQSLGLPAIEKFRNDYDNRSVKSSGEEKELSTKEILVDYVIFNKWIWMLSAAYFFVYIVRTGIGDWTSLYLQEAKGYTLFGGTSSVSLFEVGGFFGALAAGWSSDYLFQARRAPVNFLFASMMAVSIGAFYLIPEGYPILDSVAVFAIGFAVFGPQMLIGVAAAELSHKKAAATSTGFIGCFAYIGAAAAGMPLGKLIEDLGWESFVVSMIVCSTVSALLLIPLLASEKKKIEPVLAEA